MTFPCFPISRTFADYRFVQIFTEAYRPIVNGFVFGYTSVTMETVFGPSVNVRSRLECMIMCWTTRNCTGANYNTKDAACQSLFLKSVVLPWCALGQYNDGWVQDCGILSAMNMRESCTKPSISWIVHCIGTFFIKHYVCWLLDIRKTVQWLLCHHRIYKTTSSNGNLFALLALCEGNQPVTGGLPPSKASGTELWRFLWSAPEQTIEQAIETLVIRDAMALIMTSLQWWYAILSLIRIVYLR